MQEVHTISAKLICSCTIPPSLSTQSNHVYSQRNYYGNTFLNVHMGSICGVIYKTVTKVTHRRHNEPPRRHSYTSKFRWVYKIFCIPYQAWLYSESMMRFEHSMQCHKRAEWIVNNFPMVWSGIWHKACLEVYSGCIFYVIRVCPHGT